MITSFQDLISATGGLIKLLLPISVAAAVLVFFWGLANFILHTDNAEAHEEGRNKMIWGIIILFVVVSIWGIIGLFQEDFFGGAPVKTIELKQPIAL